jgi:hypothetical protein
MLVGWGLLLGRDLASPFHGAPKPHRGYHLDGTQNRSFLDETVAVAPHSGFQGVSAGLRPEPRGGFRDGPSQSCQS